jgi:hypothetical protein
MSVFFSQIYQCPAGKHLAYLADYQNPTPEDSLLSLYRMERLINEVSSHQTIHLILKGYPVVLPEIVKGTIAIIRHANFGTVFMVQPTGILNFTTGYLRKMAFRNVGFESVKDIEEGVQFYVNRFGPNTLKKLEPPELLTK